MTDRCDRADLPCPRTDCIGLADPAFCGHYARLTAWNELTEAEQLAAFAAVGPASVPPSAQLLAAVANCPDRGSVLPVSLQAECGCGGELSECRAGKGRVAGRVTLADCLACRRAATGIA